MDSPLSTSRLHEIDLSSVRAVICDLDGTLADSKVDAEEPMLRAIDALLRRYDVGIASGGRLELIEGQVLSHLDLEPPQLERLHLLPASGTCYGRWRDGAWTTIHDFPLDEHDVELIAKVLTEVVTSLGYLETTTFGPLLDHRGGQVTFSALGQEAPPAKKSAWDSDGSKKRRVISQAVPLLPGFRVAAGKSTSIDVTRSGLDKGYGVRAVLEELDLDPEQALYFGDRLDDGGNDACVLATGVPCVQVEGWQDTLSALSLLTDPGLRRGTGRRAGSEGGAQLADRPAATE